MPARRGAPARVIRRLAAVLLGLGIAAGLLAAAERDAASRELGTAEIVFDPPGMKYALVGDAPADRGRGYSDRRPVEPKADWRLRVIAVGDSVTYGVSVSPREAWPGVLQARLPRNVDVYNFGVNGYDAEQVAALVESRLEAWKPDVLVWGTYSNDAAPTFMLYGTTTGDPVFVGTSIPPGARLLPEPLALGLVRRSALFRRVQGALYARHVAENGAVIAPEGWYREQVTRIRAWAEAHGVALVVMAAAPHVLADPAGCPARYPEPGMCEGALVSYQRITADLSATGLAWVDGLAAYQRSGAPAFFPEGKNDPDHPSPAGHALLAEAVLPAVEAAIAARAPKPEPDYRRRPPPPGP